MKLHREKFLAAAMMLSTAAPGLGGCGSKTDQASPEGINPEGAQNIGANNPNGDLAPQNGAPGQTPKLTQPGAAKFAPTPLRSPTGEGVASPVRESLPVGNVAPVKEGAGVGSPVREALPVGPAKEGVGVVPPVKETAVGAPPVATTPAGATKVPPPPVGRPVLRK